MLYTAAQPFTPHEYAQNITRLRPSGIITASPAIAEAAFDFYDAPALELPRAQLRGVTRVYQVCGHSMDDGSEHAIRDGEHVLVDTADIYTRYGGVYAYSCPENAVIAKRLGLHKGVRALLSDNPEYPPITRYRLEGIVPLGRIYAVYVAPGITRGVK